MVIKMTNIIEKNSKGPKIGSFILAPTQHYENFLEKQIQSYKFVQINSLKVYGLLSMPFIQTIYIFLSHPIK